ncbi:MAG TPA: glutamate-5-semialdehyde dehydrogenase, partial [Aestuariivirgaceae bacterium]|nr:glutamate-5-semialdehyde dehydrogenase [Aestuariivirgaceae bacterium]
MADDANLNDILALGRKARSAQTIIARAASLQKNDALKSMARHIRHRSDEILAANDLDLRQAGDRRLPNSLIDRLRLDAGRIDAIAASLEDISALPDPVGQVIAEWQRPNGLSISRVRVPIGVIGVIFESRPNVTADAGALAMKAGNAAILRGGSDSFNSSRAIADAMQRGLEEVGLPREVVSSIPTADRSAVGMMLEGLGGVIDLIVPRGGKALVERVQREARVPVFSHLEGICHVYVHGDAEMAKAAAICLNSKMRRPGVCGAAETILIDRSLLPSAGGIIRTLIEAGCEVRGDRDIVRLDTRVVPAKEDDWSTEYLDAIISVRAVDGAADAADHIRRYGSQHTDSIVTENLEAAEDFMREVDSAIVLHNASTQFADGGEFGFGAEIGIATGRLHARGPVGLEQLTTFKYKVRG